MRTPYHLYPFDGHNLNLNHMSCLNKNFYWIVILLLFPLSMYSQGTDDVELKRLYNEDQILEKFQKLTGLSLIEWIVHASLASMSLSN